MDARIPLDPQVSQVWTAVALKARLHDRIMRSVADPLGGSNLSLVDGLYPYERASVWHGSYLNAALEHLLIWADLVAPLRFHAEQESLHRLRPVYTLGRAAVEAAAQAVWVSGGGSAHECARRHLRLIRWDYVEYRKSVTDPVAKRRIRAMDEQLLARVNERMTEAELRPPGLLEVLRGAAEVVNSDPDLVERVWRAASGAAHGKYWPSLALQHVVQLDEREPGQLRTLSVPDTERMTEVLELASHMTGFGVLRHVDFSGLEIQPLLDEATRWLATVVPLREDADADVIERLASRGCRPGPDSTADASTRFG